MLCLIRPVVLSVCGICRLRRPQSALSYRGVRLRSSLVFFCVRRSPTHTSPSNLSLGRK